MRGLNGMGRRKPLDLDLVRRIMEDQLRAVEELRGWVRHVREE